MARVVLIRHGHDHDDDRVVTFFRNKGLEPEILRPFAGDALGDVGDDVIASVIYGGDYSVFDEDKHPFLHDENRWIMQAIGKNIPLLGICQGAQSIARALGAEVGPTEDDRCEFGYYPVFPTTVGQDYFPMELVVAQSHFHEFQLPKGADLLAYSESFGQQAFKYGDNVFAFQFHAEITPRAFRIWQEEGKLYSQKGTLTRAEQDLTMQKADLPMHRWFMSFQEKLFGPTIEAIIGYEQHIKI